MARRYSVDGQATNTVNESIITCISTAAVKPQIYDLILGSDAAPADNAYEYEIQRVTSTGSGGTAVTPQALDPDDPVSVVSAIEDPSGEPTPTSNALMLQFAVNQRATFRWVAAPDGEIVLPATANAGVSWFVRTVSSSSTNTNICYHFVE